MRAEKVVGSNRNLQAEGQGDVPSGNQFPIVTERTVSRLELLPDELLYVIGTSLKLPEWIALGALSKVMNLKLSACLTPFHDQTIKWIHRLGKQLPVEEVITKLGNLYGCLDLDFLEGRLSDENISVVAKALANSDTWHTLNLYLGCLGASNERILSMIALLIDELEAASKGNTSKGNTSKGNKFIDINSSLNHFHAHGNAVATLLSKVAPSKVLQACAYTSESDPVDFEFIAQLETLNHLNIWLRSAYDIGLLENTLKASKVKLSHLTLRTSKPYEGLHAIGKALAGKCTVSITQQFYLESEWAKLADTPVGFQFQSWIPNGLEKLSLWAVAKQADGIQLQQALSATTSLKTLQLSGYNFQHLQAGLAQGLMCNTSLQQLELAFPFETFPTALLEAVMHSKNLREMTAGDKAHKWDRTPYCVHFRRLPDNSARIENLTLDAVDLPAAGPCLAQARTIGSLEVLKWEELSNSKELQQGRSRQDLFHQGLEKLTIKGKRRPFQFSSFPFSFTSLPHLHLYFQQLDLKGIADDLANTTKLKVLNLGGDLTLAGAKSLLDGLKRNQSVETLRVDFCVGDAQDDMLYVRFLCAVLDHPSLSSANIGFNSKALVELLWKSKPKASGKDLSFRLRNSDFSPEYHTALPQEALETLQFYFEPRETSNTDSSHYWCQVL